MSLPVRARRVIARISIAVSVLCLLAVAVFPVLRQHAPAGGLGIIAAAVVSIAACLACLRGPRQAALTVTGADREKWAQVRTLADLGELTAQWLEGTIPSQPGYCGPCDIEDPALIPLLARLNRVGFVTAASQAGESGPGSGGTHWDQHAAVEGYAGEHLAVRLAQAAWDAGLDYVLYDPAHLPRRQYRYRGAVTITRRDGRPHASFGVQVPRRHIRDPLVGYGICHPDAVKALCQAWQVTLIDPEPGRWASPLWEVLGQAIRPDWSTS
jgi:hypothetical protein